MMSFLDWGWIIRGMFIFLCVVRINSYLVDGEFGPGRGRTVSYKYERIAEVKKECASVIASASVLKPDDNRVFTLKEELSFLNGDWWQELKEAPLMPFDDRDLGKNPSDMTRSPLSLVSFWVMDVDHAHRSKNWVAISATLQMGITMEDLFIEKPHESSPRFNVWPGHSQMFVSFQGIYSESEKNGGERVMCLLGHTMLPSRQPGSKDPWEWMKDPGYTDQPPLVEDDQILLVLRYPRTFSLVHRAIQGSLKSLNKKSNVKYFDEVQISSRLGTAANYEFDSGKLVSRACDPYPYIDSYPHSFDMYKGMDFCSILERFTQQEGLAIVPNWKCNGTDDFCSQLGPFASDKEIKATDGSFKDVKFVIQDVRCEKMNSKGDDGFERVSSVVRAVPPLQNQFTAAQRTGFNNMTLASEGIWKSSTGQLCMVGCLGYGYTENSGCDSRICLYVPLSFSITQRSIVVGTISSIKNGQGSFFPLTFEKLIRPAELWDQYTAARPYYKYSKVDEAGALLEKNEPFNFANMVKKSFLQFPKQEDAQSSLVSLSLLSEDLTLHVAAVPDQFPRSSRTDLQLEVLSLGPVFGRYWYSSNISTTGKEEPFHEKVDYKEKQLLLNVSAQINLVGESYGNFSMLFVEGLYDEHVGKMYLIGCRDVRASWKLLYESMDLESGLDCLTEVIVSYPPTTARWIADPTARISISSKRSEDDPFYFKPIKLQTFPIMYRRQREDILSRRGVEGILRILTLSLAIACLLSQIFYIRDNAESVPYISLVMLGIQALGYSIPLITGAEAFFEKMASESYESSSYELDRSQWIRTIEYTVKFLVLVAFSLTLRLCQKVWKSRIRLLTRTPLEPHRVPNDKKVLVSTMCIHVAGYILILLVHSLSTSQKPVQTQRFVDASGNYRVFREWETQLEEYVGLVQDLFLLPQIIGNCLWKIHNKPLRKFYYIGITSVRLLPHLYDYVRSPIPNPYFSEEYEFVNPRFDFYTNFGDIAIPVMAIVLAVAIYIQQKWTYEKLHQTLSRGQAKLLPLGSRVYQRLPSLSFEAELASDVNKGIPHQKEPNEE